MTADQIIPAFLPKERIYVLYYSGEDLYEKKLCKFPCSADLVRRFDRCEIEQMALHMEIPRNRIVRRMLELMLSDIDKGRMLYPEEKCS